MSTAKWISGKYAKIIIISLAFIGLYIVRVNLANPARLPVRSLYLSESLNVELVEQLGGGISSGQVKPLAVRGNLVYSGMGPRLVVLDISDPSHISILGQSDIIPGMIGEIALMGNYVYIASGPHGDNEGNNQKLHIVDVTDPAQPRYVASYAPEGKSVSSVFVSEDYLFITAMDMDGGRRSPDGDFYILDPSNPEQPKELGHYVFRTGISDIETLGQYVYLSTNEPGLQILDISDAREPSLVEALYPSTSGGEIVLKGNYLYIDISSKEIPWGFDILDVSNPKAPLKVASHNLDINASKLVSVYQNIAYFFSLGSQDSITYFDISDPNNPIDLGTQEFEGRVVSIYDHLAFIMDGSRFKIFDITDPSNPAEIGSYSAFVPEEGWPALYLSETIGIVPVSSSDWSGLYILDFSQPTLPVIRKLYNIEDLRNVIGVNEGIVYYTTFAPSNYYGALDISDPGKPDVVWRNDIWDDKGNPFFLMVEGNYAYWINADEGIYLQDISDPANPKPISHQEELKGFDGFLKSAIYGNYMYILDGRELHVLDISEPTTIARVGIYNFPADQSGYSTITIIDGLAFVDNSLFSGSNPTKLLIFDLSDPPNLKLITSYDWSGYSAIEGISRSRIFINDHSGLHVVDFSEPKEPIEIGYYGIDQYGAGLFSLVLGEENIIYVSSYPNGLYVLRYLPPAE
jgi:hypothetical protein